MGTFSLLLTSFLLAIPVHAATRVRDLGIVPGHFPTGKRNTITDVAGIKVGQVTLNSGKGALVPGKGPIRTGVTVIMPSNDVWNKKLPAGEFVLNGNGEAMGLMWVRESGYLETPIALTNTLNVADVQKGLLQWMMKKYPKIGISDDTLTPLVFECDDGSLNDIRGMHVKPEHVIKAIESASADNVSEGSVGAGTGMISYEFKAGIGTASRVIKIDGKTYTVGVLLNANHGARRTLRVLGNPVGDKVPEHKPKFSQDGSIVVIVATDAPLDGRQLSRVAKRAFLGIARTGGIAYNGSGDIALAFSTAYTIPHRPEKATYQTHLLSDFWVDPVFEAAAEAAEEALYNALVASPTMEGRDGNTVYGLPHEAVKAAGSKPN